MCIRDSYYLEHKKPEIVEKTVKADSENKAAYTENKKNKADDRKRRARLLALQREMDSLEAVSYTHLGRMRRTALLLRGQSRAQA